MLWFCTNWDTNWDAISAIATASATITALVLATAEARRRSRDSKARSLLLAQWILPCLITLEAHLAGALVDFGRPEEDDAAAREAFELQFDRELSEASAKRADITRHAERLNMAEIDRFGLDLQSLPSDARADLNSLRLNLTLAHTMLGVAASPGVEAELLHQVMSGSRDSLADALADTRRAKSSLAVLSQPRFLKAFIFKMRRRRNRDHARKIGMTVD